MALSADLKINAGATERPVIPPSRFRNLPEIAILLLPAFAAVLVLFGGSMAVIVVESFKVYTAGRIIQPWVGLTLENYTYFVTTRYFGFFLATIRLAVISALISSVLAYPLAYTIARTSSPRVRSFLITLTVMTLFLGGMVRVVSLVVLLGGQGLLNSALVFFGFQPVALIGTEAGVLVGLVHFQVSIAVLALVGAIQNVDPHLEEAAQGLGASRIRTFFEVTLPLSGPGILAAVILSFAGAVSAFTIPLFLGKGIVNMISNLIYDRFSDILNFPEGSALAVILLAISLAITYLFNKSVRGVSW